MDNIYLFIFMCILLILLPGPDTVLVMKNTIVGNKTGGFKTILGITCSLLVHTFAAVLGLSAIIVKSAILFSIFKYVGAIYLIYLGANILWSLLKKEESKVDLNTNNKNISCFKQGFFSNILNPKVAIFFLSFFPQFITHEGNTFFAFLLMGVIFTLLSIVFLLAYVYLTTRIEAAMQKPLIKNMMELTTGTIMIGFGIKLALQKVSD